MKFITGQALDAKINQLKQVHADALNWLVYYLDEDTTEKWVKEYPHSALHGGGPPQLRKIGKFPWE